MKRPLHLHADMINAVLPDIPPEFENRMRGLIDRLPQQEKEKPMKKKLSVGLVVALALTLLAVGALAAALLGGKDFVDQILAPKAAESASEKYTHQEIAEILKIAEENHITLPDDLVNRLAAAGDGYYKEELMRVFVKTEYGFFPSAWPIEVQAWYDQMLYACGQDEIITNVLPEGDEITQEQALNIARAAILAADPAAQDLEDTALYLRHMTYTQEQVNPSLMTRSWYIEYMALDLTHPDYWLSISSEGVPSEVRISAGIDGAADDMPGMFIGDRFNRVYGDQYGYVNWTSELLLQYQQALQNRVEKDLNAVNSMTRGEKAILAQEYLLPDDTMIPREQAIAAAKAALGNLPYTTEYNNSQMAVCLMGENGPIWKVTLDVQDQGMAYAELDAKTGAPWTAEVNAAQTTDWRSYATEAYFAEHQPQPDAFVSAIPTARPDGKPGIWYSDAAPDWYWEKLDQVNYTGETADALMTGWYQAYGSDRGFWPLEAQAIDYYWHDLYDAQETILPGLPDETDLQQESAEQLAREAFRIENAGRMPDLNVDSLLAQFSFWYNTPDRGKRQWNVTFVEKSGAVAGVVSLDAETGEIYAIDTTGYEPAPDATPAPQADGSPWMWGSDLAPAAFWDTLTEKGYTNENIDDLIAHWYQEYGDNDAAWPLEYQAAYYILRVFQPGDTQLIGFPGENDLTKEQALAKAWETIQEVRAKSPDPNATEAWLHSLVPSASFWYNAPEMGKTQWTIYYNDPVGIKGWVILDGQTGEVLQAELDLMSNG